MKIAIVIVLLGLTLNRCNPTPTPTPTPNLIGPGHWTIEKPMRYQFEFRTAGKFRLGPTLTLGENGAMLAVQIEQTNKSVSPPGGADVTAVVRAGSGTLRVLESPVPGKLLAIQNTPMALWYLEPPAAGTTVSSIEVRVGADSATWQFSEGRLLPP